MFPGKKADTRRAMTSSASAVLTPGPPADLLRVRWNCQTRRVITRPGSFAYLGPGWADAGSAQYYLSKSYAAEGGIRVPAIVSGGVVNTASRSNDSLFLAYDVVPTMLELAGAESDSDVIRGDKLPIAEWDDYVAENGVLVKSGEK